MDSLLKTMAQPPNNVMWAVKAIGEIETSLPMDAATQTAGKTASLLLAWGLLSTGSTPVDSIEIGSLVISMRHAAKDTISRHCT